MQKHLQHLQLHYSAKYAFCSEAKRQTCEIAQTIYEIKVITVVYFLFKILKPFSKINKKKLAITVPQREKNGATTVLNPMASVNSSAWSQLYLVTPPIHLL